MKKLDNEKPNWARMVRIKKPTGGVYPGCWEEGRVVGYAEAITDLKKDLAARLTICDNIITNAPKGWPTIIMIAERRLLVPVKVETIELQRIV